MFGYINVNGAQLSEENKKIYQSYYCGLCRKLKEFCGKKGQALLNYDMTFLVVLLTGLYEPDTQTGEFTCMMHPMKKRQLRENDIQSYAAQITFFWHITIWWMTGKMTIITRRKPLPQCLRKIISGSK